MKKKIKAWALMNHNEENGHEGILWFGEGAEIKEIPSIPLMIFSDEKHAVSMASRRGDYKVVPVEIKINVAQGKK